MLSVTIDGGPSENLHRRRGIGTCVRSLIESLDAAPPADAAVTYLRSIPATPNRSRWRRRSPLARLSGVDERVPDRLALTYSLVDVATVMPGDVRRAGADVLLATDPNFIAIDRRFATVAVLYDLIPLVFSDQYLDGMRNLFRRALFLDSMRRVTRARGVIAISDATRADAERRLGIPRSRIAVAPLAVDHRLFRPVGERVDGPWRSAPYVLYVGEVDPRKNIDALIEAFAQQPGRDTHLVCAGASPAGQQLIRSKVPTAVADRVHLIGHVPAETLVRLYSGATAFVFPSVYEGFGLPVLEAMACGAPVICFDVSAMPETAGNAAILVDPMDPSALRDAITRVATSADARAEYRERGLARAAGFTWIRTRDAMLDAARALGA